MTGGSQHGEPRFARLSLFYLVWDSRPFFDWQAWDYGGSHR